MINERVSNVIILTGASRKKENNIQMEKLRSIPKDESMVIIATGKFVGPGFYVTLAEEEQAKVWAKQKAMYPRPIPEALNMLGMTMQDFIVSKNNFKPVIIKFKIKDIENWKKLNNNIFLEDSFRWREFVWTWRQAY